MTDRIEDGGPAFPHLQRHVSGNTYEPIAEGGMTLRDWFAGQALAGLAGASFDGGESDFLSGAGTKSAARWAYSFADAMLAARKDGAA